MLMIALSLPLAAKGDKDSKKTEEAKDTTAAAPKKNAYEKLMEKKSKSACGGMMNLYLIDGKVYFEIPTSLLGREFLMGSTIRAISDNADGVVGAKNPELQHITFTMAQDSSILLRKVTSATMTGDDNILQAISKSSIGPIVKKFKAAAYNADSTAVVVDLTDVFLSHDKDMSPFNEYGRNSSYQREEQFKKENSYITEIKSFSDNVSVASLLSYTYSLKGADGKKVAKNVPFSAELNRSIVLLPEEVYHPRRADYRIGVFWTEREVISGGGKGTGKEYFANRFRLEPSDTVAYRAGKLVEPVKPIVFYIDPAFPEWWRPYLKEGVEQWQELFENVGFKNAIVAKDFPTDDPEFDPENIKYNCIRYAPIGIQNAMGPSWVDPRSGEIINASVYVYHDIVKLISRWMFVQLSAVDETVRTTQLPREVLGEQLRYVLSHEVGHCLGFMHNMSGSSVIPVDSLRSPSFTQKYGTTTSIMDYARFNYVAQRGDKERGVKLTPPRFGLYDRYLVNWTYTPVFDVDSFEEEAEITTRWITDSVQTAPFYRYGKQQFETGFFDPRSQNEDLGDDAVAASAYGIVNLKYIMENFMDWIPDEDDPDFEFRTNAYVGVLNQYLAYAQHVMLNVGGLYKNEVKACDTLFRYKNVPLAKQLEAMKFVMKMRDDLDWVSPKEVTDRLPVIGSAEYAVNKGIADMIFMMPSLCSMSDGIASDEMDFSQCMEKVIDYAFGPKKNLSDGDRYMQRMLVDGLIEMARFPKKSVSKVNGIAQFDKALQQMPEQWGGCNVVGEITFNPVAGFEWMPRQNFINGRLSVSTVYTHLDDIRKIVKKRTNCGTDSDRAHYQLLLKTIDYAIE